MPDPGVIIYLRDNTQLQAYVQGSPEKVDQILRGSVIEDLNGWNWHIYGGTYTAADGTTKPYIPTTKAVKGLKMECFGREIRGRRCLR